MASDGQSIERLRDYLKTLSPEARSMLVQQLERSLLSGEEGAGNDLVLQELRRAIRGDVHEVPRIGDTARLFFAPLEPFLIDGPADHKRIGRIARVSLEPIWAWVGRDLIPAEVKALGDDINRALLADDRNRANQLVRTLQDRSIRRMRDALAEVSADEKSRRRLAVQVGTPRAIEDLDTIVSILSLREMLADFGKRLPSQFKTFEREQIEPLWALLDAATAPSALERTGARKADAFSYCLILVMNRLASPWQLVRVASRAADGDDTARIADTPYAAAVGIVLGEAENMVAELRTEVKAGRPVVSMLKNIHDTARELRSEINMSFDSPWSRQLAAIRNDVSALLKSEIETTPGSVRRLLRPRPNKEIAPGSQLDPLDVEQTEARVAFICACRHYAAELALSEATMRAHSELTHILDTGTKILLESLRQAGNDDRPFRQSQLEAGIRFCRPVFGAEYAGTLAKAAEVAVQAVAAPPAERKPARA
jgi:hypothetical protein